MNYLRWCYFVSVLISRCVTVSYAVPALKTLSNTESDTARIAHCRKLIQLCLEQRKFDSCQFYINQGISLAQKANNTIYHSALYLTCGNYLRERGQLRESIDMLSKARYYAVKNNQIKKIATIDYTLAMNYSDKALMNNRKNGFTVALTKIYRNIEFTNKYYLYQLKASNYSLLSNFYEIYQNDSLAYKFLGEVVYLLEKSKDSDKHDSYILLSKIQLDLFYKCYNQAAIDLQKLLQFRNRIKKYEFSSYVGLVTTYTKFNEYNQAIKMANSFQGNSEIMAFIPNRDKALLFCCLTSAYLHKHMYQKAKMAYQKTLSYATNTRTSQLRMRILQSRKELLEFESRFREALQVANELESLKDSIQSNQAIFELAASQERFENKVNENNLLQQIKLQKLENKYKEQTLAQSRKIQWLSTLIIAFLVLVIIISMIQVKRSSQQTGELKALNDTQNQLFSIISHDLRSPITGLQTFLSIINDKTYSPAITRTFTDLEMQVSTVNNTLDNLLNWSVTQMNGIKPKIRRVNLLDCVEHIMELSGSMIQYKNITLIKNIQDAYVYADENLTEVVIRNVLNNAIKFSLPKGIINVSFIHKDDKCILHIKDWGIGMSETQVATLFHDNNSRRGTLGEKGSGLGLKLSKDLMAMQSGEIEIDSIVNVGTVVNLVFKKII